MYVNKKHHFWKGILIYYVGSDNFVETFTYMPKITSKD